MIDTALKYNFPTNNSDPFESTFDGNYFVFANAFSNLNKDLNAFSFDTFEKNIPMGYKTIIVCHRVAHFENGKVKQEWPFTDIQNLTRDINSGKYLLTSNKLHIKYVEDWNRNVESAVIYRPETTDRSLSSSTWDNLDICKEYAAKLSIETNSEMLVSIIIDSVNWH